jgi:hypothetical protein
VGDRFIHRDSSAEVTGVSGEHVEIEVADPNSCFRKSVPRDEYPVLVQRTIRNGAVFKASPENHPPPSTLNLQPSTIL